MANPYASGSSPTNVQGFTAIPALAEKMGVSYTYLYKRVKANLIPTVQICGMGTRLIPNHLVPLIMRGVDVRDMDPTDVPEESAA